MMNIQRFGLLMLFISALFISSCQEEVIIINDPGENAIIGMSPLADLVVMTTMKDGSADNIIDNSSCISVVLPVEVVVNGSELVISSPEDYKLIERIFDESSTDTDVLEIIFPIKVILADFTELTIANHDDLEDLVEECVEGGEDLDIECIDFKYPISLSVYNTANQTLDAITVDSDEALNNFMESLSDNIVVSFNYPITLILSDDAEVEVNNNEELESLIESVDDTCDEDDNNDFDDDDIDDTALYDTMKSASWKVSYYFNIIDETLYFEGYVFNFLADEIVIASKDNKSDFGEWETYGDDGQLEVEMEFVDESSLNVLNDDWNVITYDSESIQLSITDSDGDVRYLTFEKTTDPGIINTISNYVIIGEWGILEYEENQVDKTADYSGYKLTFTEDNNLNATDGNNTLDGNWEESFESGTHQFMLEFDPVAPFEILGAEWEVSSYTESRIELEFVDTDKEVNKKLVLEKL